MDSKQAALVFEALSAELRLDVFRLLVRHAPQGLVAGELSRQLGIPSTNLSFHLKTLAHSGLVEAERQGRFIRYKAAIPLMLELVAYLTAECCANEPEACRRFREASQVAPGILPGLPGSGV